ncbi:MAG: hypothetical protein KKD28_10715 [Chloroflexi bacterium]|nr:hypothetical protein [Chloroflexota bacterium]MBU1661928.1 hypothetical protein [Chloroflexota bacterium]
MSRPRNLYNLQQIDSQLDQHRSRLRAIEITLADNTAIERAGKKVTNAQNALDETRKSLHNAERKVRDQRLKIEQTEAILYSGKVRNPKELQDMQNEAAALRRFLSVLEDRQLEAMLFVDEIKAPYNAALDTLTKMRAKSEQLQTKLIAERATIEKNIRQLETKRQAALSSIADEDIQVYKQLRKQRAGVAVAAVNDRACAACGATLAAALFQAARSPSKITHCDSCGRILYST